MAKKNYNSRLVFNSLEEAKAFVKKIPFVKEGKFTYRIRGCQKKSNIIYSKLIDAGMYSDGIENGETVYYFPEEITPKYTNIVYVYFYKTN